MRKLIILAPILLLSFFSLFASTIPASSGWINDFADIINPVYKEKINTLISELEEKTGIEIVVATFKSISPYEEKEFARMLFDKWKPGKKNKDNGVLILIAEKERLWRIETGYGIEEDLPDGLCGQIGRDYMLPYFRAKDYGKGIYVGVSKIANIFLKGNLKEVGISNKEKSLIPFYFIVSLVIYFLSCPFPIFISLPLTLLFIFITLSTGPKLLSLILLIAYIAAMLTRYSYWKKLPKEKRKSFFGPLDFDSKTSSCGWGSGGFRGGRFGGGIGRGGFGGGGFGGGIGGGGGAGGKF
jgi:uncharacterized protein